MPEHQVRMFSLDFRTSSISLYFCREVILLNDRWAKVLLMEHEGILDKRRIAVLPFTKISPDFNTQAQFIWSNIAPLYNMGRSKSVIVLFLLASVAAVSLAAPSSGQSTSSIPSSFTQSTTQTNYNVTGTLDQPLCQDNGGTWANATSSSSSSCAVPSTVSWTIPYGGTLTVIGSAVNNSGTISISVAGAINNYGTINNSATINNSGTIDDYCGGTIFGTITGNQPNDVCTTTTTSSTSSTTQTSSTLTSTSTTSASTSTTSALNTQTTSASSSSTSSSSSTVQ